MSVLLLQSLEPEFFDWGWLRENFSEEVWPAVIGHLYLSFVSVGIALAISLPLGVLVARYRKLYTPVLFVTGFLFTIPSLALFAILVTIPGIGIGQRLAERREGELLRRAVLHHPPPTASAGARACAGCDS